MAAAIPTGEPRGAARFVPAPTQSEFSRRREKGCGAATIHPFDVYSWRRAFTPKQENEHRARVRFCQDRAWRLTEWERGFLNNVARLHGNLSIKQADRLAAMTDRLDMEVRQPC
ncbi:hypothetical protein MKK63_24035 [Methylobacterium sp. J-088]|uniref:hypothetical protein n=1 Tax=Methylobacterium sp. J-088 TaxID=2836664 RepID=UPI001FBA751C|nr:hypothetical protein [Methylobacterium sp. J-088]MCJ2065749.1 hypothetical protein [Methylobacterium sp. J-088]